MSRFDSRSPFPFVMLKNLWYVVAAAADLREQLLPVTLLGHRFVAFRIPCSTDAFARAICAFSRKTTRCCGASGRFACRRVGRAMCR
ncbi:hypothetical protein AB4Y42_07065 [Paraburkholderia sp. EG286B]|uniref:hypothetical protein n=1 Tax=Paraburkholderia sp. EG286B TaxID=3237011 RepID=UPI0034D33D9C